jgi:hypothetical protein
MRPLNISLEDRFAGVGRVTLRENIETRKQAEYYVDLYRIVIGSDWSVFYHEVIFGKRKEQ